jgi:hypothetical protein
VSWHASGVTAPMIAISIAISAIGFAHRAISWILASLAIILYDKLIENHFQFRDLRHNRRFCFVIERKR